MSSVEAQRRLDAANAEMQRRAKEALSVYRPSDQQLPFHESGAKETVLRGGKRSGKSTAVVMEFASRVLGTPITRADGSKIPLRFAPSSDAEPLLYWVIGWDIKHIGQTLHRLLFEPGLFRIIPDKVTKKWRVYNPAIPDDVLRFDESEPSPPVIPARLVKEGTWSWENKAANVFESVELINGAKICAFPSSGKSPKQGDAVAGIWIDEDIQNGGHLKEWQDRLTDKGGWFTWSVWPHTQNYALIELLDRAEEAEGEESPKIQAFQLMMTKNAFIAEENKADALSRMGSEDEIARRDRGELLLDALSMYDFAPALHLVKTQSHDKPANAHELIESLLRRFGRLPKEWTRYLSIDPSHTRTAVAFGVVPPPEWEHVKLGHRLIIEAEVIAKKHSAVQLADVLLPMMSGVQFEAFVMDQNAGRQTWAGQDLSVFEHYTKAFRTKGLISRQTKSGFIPGCNKPQERYRAVRELLRINDDGYATLMLVEDKTPFTQREFQTYRKKQQNIGGEEVILDEPLNPRKHDCMAAMEYLVAHVQPLFELGTAYVESNYGSSGGSPAYRAAMKMLKREKDRTEYVHLGPGAAA